MGRKKKIVKYYPKPQYRTVIEPFAGSAPYSIEHWAQDVILIDKYSVIIGIWKYLQQATYKDIVKLPSVENGKKIPDAELLCEEERNLIGFCINNGSVRPKFTAGRMNFNSWERDKFEIANNLYKIHHWQFILGEYNCLENVEATYFIDPPYQYNKWGYVEKFSDYVNLANWCKSRKGQVMVCDKAGADYLPFVPLVKTSGQRGKQSEVIWYQSTID